MSSWSDLIPAQSAEAAAPIDGEAVQGRPFVVEVLGTTAFHYGGKASSLKVWREIEAWPAERLRASALALHEMACGGLLGMSEHGAVLNGLCGLDLPWTRADLIWALHRAARMRASDQATLHYSLPAAIASKLSSSSLLSIEPALSALMAEIHDDYFVSAEAHRRLTPWLGIAIATAKGAGLPAWLFHDGDGFGRGVRDELGAELASPGVVDLLKHCTDLSKPVPPAKWLKRARELSGMDAHALVRGILRKFITVPGGVHDDTDCLLRGMIWVAAGDEGKEATELLSQVLTAAAEAPRGPGYPRAPKTAAAAVAALVPRRGDTPLMALARTSLVVRNKALLSRVRAALGELAALRGWSADEVMELAVDEHGLDAEATLTEQVDGHVVTVSIVAGKAKLSAPAAVKEHATVRRLRERVKDIGKTLATERLRVEGLLSQEREWAWETWVQRYLTHPVTSVFGRQLIWESTTDGVSWHAGVPVRGDHGWELSGARGGRVRLWHPTRATAAEVERWRALVSEGGLAQPFKQAFREVYLLTPAEVETGRYSNRFASHILRYRQANALMRVRGWQAGYLGTWDGGYESEAVKEFGGGDWRAVFFHSLVENEDRHDYTVHYCSTDQVRFHRRCGAAWDWVPLNDVPPLVFSEAMRDVDLFVGVTSIAGEPSKRRSTSLRGP